MDLFYIIASLFNQNQIKMRKSKDELFQKLNLGKEQRYTISVPFYAEHLHDVNVAMDKIAKAIDVPYVSVSVQDQDYSTTFVESREYVDGEFKHSFRENENKNYELFLDFGESIGTQTIYSSSRIADCVKRQANMLKDLDKYYTTEWQGLPKDVVAINIDETTITLDNRFIKTLNEE